MRTLELPRTTCGWGTGTAKTFRNQSYILMDKWGTNLQNPTNNICKIHVPDTGYSMIQADQSGAEALIVAYLCRAGNFRNLFLCNIKPHVYVALHVFQSQLEKRLGHSLSDYTTATISGLKSISGWKDVSDIIKSSDGWDAYERYYFIAKMICHASNYAATAGALQKHILVKSDGVLALPKRDCERFLSVYHSLFPEIREWHALVEDELKSTGELVNLFGFPRKFFGPLSNYKTIKEALAFVPQSTVGCITNMAFVEVQDWLEHNPEVEWDLLNNKHDSVMMQAPHEEALVCAALLQSCMQRPLISPRGEKFQMKSEVSLGRNWAKYDEKTNPLGLKETKI